MIMSNERNIQDILSEQAKNVVYEQQPLFEITPLDEIMGRIKKRKRKKVINYVVKPTLFLIAFVSIAFIALLFSDSPEVNALKFKLFNIKYTQESQSGDFEINNKDNYTVLENTDYNLLIEFYDVTTARDRMNTKLYFPSYIPEIYNLECITYSEDLVGPDVVNILFKSTVQYYLRINMTYLYEDYSISGTSTGAIYKDITINNILVSLSKDEEHETHNATFIYENIHFTISGTITEWELIKVIESLFE